MRISGDKGFVFRHPSSALLLRLIEENQDLFANFDYGKIAHGFADDHADTLRDIGEGNRFRGMQKIGFYDWFRQGKNPEEEWAADPPHAHVRHMAKQHFPRTGEASSS